MRDLLNYAGIVVICEVYYQISVLNSIKVLVLEKKNSFCLSEKRITNWKFIFCKPIAEWRKKATFFLQFPRNLYIC